MFIVEWIKNLFQKQPPSIIQDYDRYKGRKMSHNIRTQLYLERFRQLKKLYPKMKPINICEMIAKENGVKTNSVYSHFYRNKINIRNIK